MSYMLQLEVTFGNFGYKVSLRRYRTLDLLILSDRPLRSR